MASTSDRRDEELEGMTFIMEDDGRNAARDTETRVASYGESKSEALRMLAEALELNDGDGESSDEDLRSHSSSL